MRHFSDRIYRMKQHCTVHDLLLVSTTKPKRHRTMYSRERCLLRPFCILRFLTHLLPLVLVWAYYRNC